MQTQVWHRHKTSTIYWHLFDNSGWYKFRMQLIKCRTHSMFNVCAFILRSFQLHTDFKGALQYIQYKWQLCPTLDKFRTQPIIHSSADLFSRKLGPCVGLEPTTSCVSGESGTIRPSGPRHSASIQLWDIHLDPTLQSLMTPSEVSPDNWVSKFADNICQQQQISCPWVLSFIPVQAGGNMVFIICLATTGGSSFQCSQTLTRNFTGKTSQKSNEFL